MSVVLVNENCSDDYDMMNVWVEYPEVDVSTTAYQCTELGGIESLYMENAAELLNKYTVVMVGTVGGDTPL